MLATALLLFSTQATLSSDTIRYSVALNRGEYEELIEAKDNAGKWHTVATSPTHSLIKSRVGPETQSALIEGVTGPYAVAPSLHFTQMSGTATAVELHSQIGSHSIGKLVSLTKDGKRIRVLFADDISGDRPKLQQLLSLYAFLPDGRAQKPDSTHSPQLRPFADNVIGDHIFREPFVTAQKGNIALSVIPDIDILSRRRALPTILELDCDNGVTDAPLMGFGFCNYAVSGHVRYSRLQTPRAVPAALRFAYYLEPTAVAEPATAFQSPGDFVWEQYGRPLAEKTLPQVMPWQEYANVCYPAAMSEQHGTNKLGWFEHEIEGVTCGGIYAGWGYTNGQVSWQCWFNNLRSAWGLRYFGEQQGNALLIERANKMLNLALAAPLARGAFPTSYDARKRQWIGTLIQPDTDYYYDLPSMAWKGIWLIEWLPFNERTEEIKRQCRLLAKFFIDNQYSDGSFPSWMTKDFKAGAILGHSAQSSLPGWFLARWNQVEPSAALLNASKRCGDFLIKDVIPQERYYDFETFFSCSPKALSDDDDQMRDKHTLEPPQNTLCMQWSAELLRMLYVQTMDPRYLKFGRMALDKMNTYQTVWAPPFILSAYCFGGYGVQNSDGEHLDARQAQFGVTNFEWGVLLQDRNLCLRGVAATRAAMTLISHPLHELNLLYPQPNYVLGLEPENVAHGGYDHQAGRTGFDWGEGSGLASAAWLLKHFDSVYASKNGDWAVAIDALTPDRSMGKWRAYSALNLTINPWSSPFTYVMNGKRETVPMGDGIGHVDLTYQDDGSGIARVNAFAKSGTLSISESTPQTASGLPLKDGSLKFHLAPAVTQTATFHLDAGGKRYEKVVKFLVNPSWDFEKGTDGWSFVGNVPDNITSSTRYNFGQSGAHFIGTCEDGFGGFDDGYTFRALSPQFVCTKRKLKLLVGGGSGERTYVALLDASGRRIAVAHGANKEAMSEVVWDLGANQGKLMQIEIVDRDLGAWGHINADHVRASD